MLGGCTCRWRAEHVALCALGVAACVLFGVRALSIPALGKVSNAQVQRLTALVTPKLPAGGPVFIGDNGAGTGVTSRTIDVEEFIGLVNQLDVAGYHPRVNALWRPEFGPGYLANGKKRRVVLLSTWRPTSGRAAGYVGRVGDMGVTVTDENGRAVRWVTASKASVAPSHAPVNG